MTPTSWEEKRSQAERELEAVYVLTVAMGNHVLFIFSDFNLFPRFAQLAGHKILRYE